MKNPPRTKAFTLIELLVVISIIALLIGILLPALGAARKSAQSLKAAANSRNISQGANVYSSENRDYLPPAYAYPTTPTGDNWRWENQYGSASDNLDGNNGYLHWSYALFGGAMPDDAFESPASTNGGAPRTNWGRDPNDSERWQISDRGDNGGNSMELQDRQVARIGFTVNGAIMPRNKFNERENRGTQRENVLVRIDQINFGSGTILATEMEDRNEWRSAAGFDGDTDGGAGGDDASYKSKAHRPIMPFKAVAGGSVYDADNVNYPRKAFMYYTPDDIWDEDFLRRQPNAILGSNESQINIISREHNGKANFAFVDGHTSLHTIRETLENSLWGDRFYSITEGLSAPRGSQNNAVFTVQDLIDEGVYNP